MMEVGGDDLYLQGQRQDKDVQRDRKIAQVERLKGLFVLQARNNLSCT